MSRLFVALLAISVMAMFSSSHVHARRIVEPVRCQQGHPCPCNPPKTQPAPKYWICTVVQVPVLTTESKQGDKRSSRFKDETVGALSAARCRELNALNKRSRVKFAKG